MYEIWLAANIVWETALAHASWTVPLAVAFVALVAWAIVRGGDWRRAWRWAWTSAVVAFVAAFAALPSLSGARWSDLAYVVDWALLVALAAAAGFVVGAYVWVAAAALRRRAAPRGFAPARATR